ncbi:MAG: hypothetical protein ACK57N_09330 [Planctomycetia bacterium]|jgi:hypothetical protein
MVGVDPVRTSREAAWRELCRSEGGVYTLGASGAPRVEIHDGPWTITLDDHAFAEDGVHRHHTRMRAPFVAVDGLSFRLRRRTLWDELRRIVAIDPVSTSDPTFDARHSGEANDPARLAAFLADHKLRNALLAADVREYSVKHREEGFGARLPDGVDELYLEVDGIVREHERLLSMRAALKRGLARLVELGSAEPRDPLVRL